MNSVQGGTLPVRTLSQNKAEPDRELDISLHCRLCHKESNAWPLLLAGKTKIRKH